MAARSRLSASGSAASTSSTPARILISISGTGCGRSRRASASAARFSCRASCTLPRSPRWRLCGASPTSRRSTCVGVGIVAMLLTYEQSLVSDDDLSQVKKAFDLNGYVGIIYFVATALSLYLR